MSYFPTHPNPTSIYIVGPSSTGKTTLCNALAERLLPPDTNHPWARISEVARDVMKQTGFTRNDVSRLEMQKAILVAQIERETTARADGKSILSDRSAVDPLVYGMLSGEEGQKSAKRELLPLITSTTTLDEYRHAIVVLLAPVAEFLVDDGVRSMTDHEGCLGMFKRVLGELGIKYVEMGVDTVQIEERVAVIMKLLKKVDDGETKTR